MFFGLRNAGQSFQRFMDEVLSSLDFAFCYLDDILIGSSSPEEHLLHLHLVLQRLRNFGLVLNMEKCELGQESIECLGHHITAEGAAPIVKHVEAIQNFPQPQDRKQLQSFLGLVNFYRRFIPAAAQILLPLTDVFARRESRKVDLSTGYAAQFLPHQGHTQQGCCPHSP